MKKLFILFAIVAMINTQNVSAQQENTTGKYRVYCELLGRSNLSQTKYKVSVDFGQRLTWRGVMANELVDENGEKIVFNSMIDAMNYMGALGWNFVQAYAITMANSNVYHYIMYKDIDDDSQITEGFTTRQQFREMQNAEDESETTDETNEQPTE